MSTATGLASHGLDIHQIMYVYNYNFSCNTEAYTHKIGSTVIAGRIGLSIIFITRNNWRTAAKLINIWERANQGIPEELVSMAEREKACQLRKERGKMGRHQGKLNVLLMMSY